MGPCIAGPSSSACGWAAINMIHEILPSDIEHARGMLEAGHSDTEICVNLTSRGVQPAKAAAVVEDLRHGRSPSVPLPDSLVPPHRSRRGEPHAAAHPAPKKPDSRHKHSHRRNHQRALIPWWFVLLVLAFLLALGYAMFLAGREVTHRGIQQEKHAIPTPPGK